MKRDRRTWVTVAFVLLLTAGTLQAQKTAVVDNAGPYWIQGQVIVPTALFRDSFEVRLVRDAQTELAAIRVLSQDSFKFTGLNAGIYFLEVEVAGFKRVRHRVDLRGVQREATVSIMLDFDQRIVGVEEPDLSGEETALVHVEELEGYPQELLDELRTAEKDLQGDSIDGARVRLEAIVAEAPDFYDARNALGVAYQKLHRYRDAEVQYKAARDLRPDSAAPLINLGSLYVQEAEMGEGRPGVNVRAVLNEALGHLTEALELKPDAAFAYYLLGVTYYKAAFYEDAEDNLLEALALEPRFGDTRLALANVYIQMQEWTNVLTQLDAYLEENPEASDHGTIQALRLKIEKIPNS